MTSNPRRKVRDPQCHEFSCQTRVDLLMQNRCGECTHFFCDIHLHTPVKSPRNRDYCGSCMDSKRLR